MELSEVEIPIYVVLAKRGPRQISTIFRIPMKDEYERRQRLSMVVSSTVPFAIRSMIRLFALSPLSRIWSRSSDQREVSARILQASSPGSRSGLLTSPRSKHQIGCLWQYMK